MPPEEEKKPEDYTQFLRRVLRREPAPPPEEITFELVEPATAEPEPKAAPPQEKLEEEKVEKFEPPQLRWCEFKVDLSKVQEFFGEEEISNRLKTIRNTFLLCKELYDEVAEASYPKTPEYYLYLEIYGNDERRERLANIPRPGVNSSEFSPPILVNEDANLYGFFIDAAYSFPQEKLNQQLAQLTIDFYWSADIRRRKIEKDLREDYLIISGSLSDSEPQRLELPDNAKKGVIVWLRVES